MAKYTAIGGQALIEGILMKSPEKTALAVRKPEGDIDISYMEGKSIRERVKVFKWPIIRGVVTFVESLVQGYKAMMISAEKSGFTDLEEDTKKQAETTDREETTEETVSEETVETTSQKDKKENALIAGVMVLGTVLGVVLAIALFMWIPSLIVNGIKWVFGIERMSPVVISCIEQLIKLAVFVVYVWAVAFMKDIRRVFMYHGAEHKTIFCYEKNLPLTVENVRIQRRFHPRCGTSFMILMILIAVVFSTLLQVIFPGVRANLALWVVAKILMIPLVCGAGYELLRFCGKHDNWFTRIVSAPGMWLQRITTKEPEDDMIEIAIAALRACEPENPDVERTVDTDEPVEETEEHADNL